MEISVMSQALKAGSFLILSDILPLSLHDAEQLTHRPPADLNVI